MRPVRPESEPPRSRSPNPRTRALARTTQKVSGQRRLHLCRCLSSVYLSLFPPARRPNSSSWIHARLGVHYPWLVASLSNLNLRNPSGLNCGLLCAITCTLRCTFWYYHPFQTASEGPPHGRQAFHHRL